MNSIRNLFLMKKLLKSEIYRSREQCTDPLVCTIHRLFCGQISITVPWTVTDNIFTCFSIKIKKKNAKRHTQAFFIRIQMPSKPTFGLHWNYLSACVWFFCGSHALLKGLASTDFSKFNFKTESHDTIHTFKNYFATVFSVFSNKDLFGYRLLLKTENIVTK